MKWFDLRVGGVLDVLPTLPDRSVNCCVTSPPYWGLRSYLPEGHDDKHMEIGLEPTPEEYVAKMVAVFREVRRVLRDDGTLFLNLGDSYAANRTYQVHNTRGASEHTYSKGSSVPNGLKPKDLVGIPWRVAFALQQPYYTGTIKRAEDRIWLAAMLDAEGCMFIHKRKAGQNNGQGYQRQGDNYGPGVEIANTSLAVIERIMQLVGKGSICSQSPEQNERRKQTIYRWNLRTVECREFVRELYPHLVAKQQQARILCGCPSSGERAEAAHAALISLHRTGRSDVDFPEPETMFGKGYYLRQDIVWSKANPMPESVRDRCTKSHEYIFLMSKSARYYYDAEAIAEDIASSSIARLSQDVASQAGSSRVPGKTNGPMKAVGGAYSFARTTRSPGVPGLPVQHRPDREPIEYRGRRNRRSVWTVSTKPFKKAHFATFPPDLIEPCILAGCPEGGVVLDPFIGSGTTAMVAIRNRRRCVGIELNPAYADMAIRRASGPVCDRESDLFETPAILTP